MRLRHRTDRLAVLISIIFFAAYLSTLSVSLDEEDSVHFALGLRDFNVTKFQPHSPGFPVYIALGKVFNAFLGNEVLSLTAMSALFGALSVFAFYLLSREMVDRETALAASVIMAATPLFWLGSVKAMSDMMALFFVLVSMLFVALHMKRGTPAFLYAASLVAGVSAGVRIHTFFILFPLILCGSFFRGKGFRPSSKDLKLFSGCFLLYCIAFAAWLVPTMLMTGPGEYMAAAAGQFGLRAGRPDISVIGTEPTPASLGGKIFGFIYYFMLGGYGINLADPGILSMGLLGLMALAAFFFPKGVGIRNRWIMFFLFSTVFYLAAVFVMLPPTNPRYMLILIPVLSLAFAAGMRSLEERKRYALLAAFLALMLVHTVFLAAVISTVPSPPAQMTAYAGASYGPGTVALMDGFVDKYFEYYRVSMTRLPREETGCDAIREMLLENVTVISMPIAKECPGIIAERVARFERDPRVHVKRSIAEIYELSILG